MPSEDIVISAKNLTKAYRLFGHPGDRVKQFLSLGLLQYHSEFLALKDVSFDVRRGETLGIIGRNGSGKSTLLQLICGILKPTSGSVIANGRISALLELGAGFNPEFTGRENVFFYGALMGLPREQMYERFDNIAAFADIGQYIDQPVRTYSSGMFVRLAFSVAIHLDPEILVVDEALAVGDAGFQARCFERIHSIRENGGCILLVTHALEQVAHFCDRALLLDKGEMLAIGDTSKTLACYINLTQISSTDGMSTQTPESPSIGEAIKRNPLYNSKETRWGDRSAIIEDIHLVQNNVNNPLTFSPGLTTELWMRVHFHADVEQPIYGLTIKSEEGALLLQTNSRTLRGNTKPSFQKAGSVAEVCFSFHPFLDTGTYYISVGIVGDTPSGIVPHDRRYDAIKLHIEHPRSHAGGIAMRPSFRILDPA